MAVEKSVLADPAFWVAIAALLISAVQFGFSRIDASRNNRRAQFLENIAVEFSKIEVALDTLEETLIRAKEDRSITSADIVAANARASRTTSRALLAISSMNTVDSTCIDIKKVDELDAIYEFSNSKEFDGEARHLHLSLSLQIVVRLNTSCMRSRLDVQRSHT